MSVAELRAELFKLQKEFVGGRISTLKKHEVAQRIAVMKAALSMKSSTPAGEPAPPGPLPPRDIPTASVSLDDSTTIIKPLEPAPKAEPAKKKIVVRKKVAPAEKKPMVPPKVELTEDSSDDDAPRVHVADVISRKSKATAAPSTKKPKAEAEPKEEAKAPAVPAVMALKLPGGVRPLAAGV